MRDQSPEYAASTAARTTSRMEPAARLHKCVKVHVTPARMKACAKFGLGAGTIFVFLRYKYLAQFHWKPQAGWPPAAAGGGY